MFCSYGKHRKFEDNFHVVLRSTPGQLLLKRLQDAFLKKLEEKGFIKLPNTPKYATNNGHMFYIICNSYEERTSLINYLKSKDIHPVFHYLSLNKSEYYLKNNITFDIQNSDKFTDCLLRLPFYYELSFAEVKSISNKITSFFI